MSWTRERWLEIETIFHDAARELPANRAQFLAGACAGDDDLRAAVERLLAADAGDDELLDGRATDLLDHGDPLLQRRCGPFRLIERIADGGMGTVYRAEREGGDFVQPAAVKVLRLGLSTERMRERFARERQTLARLLHPNVARLLDGGTTEDGVPYFAMELVDGVRIDRWCDERQLLQRARLELFVIVCRAVHFAHQNLVVHRDLKPGNILVDGHGVPKLVDFGVATLLADAAADGVEPGAQALTPEYASPEQRQGGAISTATDVWSLGVVLCELLTGCRSVDAAVAARRPLGGDVLHVVQKAMQREPAQRYASCQEFAEDIERCLRDLPVRAREQTYGYRGAKFVRRNRVAVVAAVGVLAALVAGIAVTLRMAAIAAEERDVADAARQRVEIEMEHARVEATSARTVAAFLGETFLGGEFAGGDAGRERLRDIIERRAGQVRRQFAGEPHLRANLIAALAHTATEARLFATATTLVDEAEQIRRAHFGGESLEVALSLAARGRLLYAQGRFEDAATTLREALRLQTALPMGVHTDVAVACNDLAAAERALGHRAKAKELHERALAIRRRNLGDDSVEVAESLNNLANAEDDLERARGQMAEALAIRERVLGADDLLTLQSKVNLARIDLARRDLPVAMTALRDAAAGARLRREVGREVLSAALSTIAYAAMQSQDDDAAMAAIDEAIAIDAGRFGADDLRVGRHHEVRANVLAARGDRGGAVAAASEWVRIARKSAPPAVLATALVSLGRFHSEAGDGAAAIVGLEEALRIMDANETRPVDLADAKLNLGNALLSVGRAAAAEGPLLAALAIYEQQPTRTHAVPRVRALLRRAYGELGRPNDAARYTDGK